ncbi:MAG: DUF998 domain-containing protein [Euryarchaeota archaeon]|nr:DUF998 domain-containing protein [Euryarchaeota archaeon]
MNNLRKYFRFSLYTILLSIVIIYTSIAIAIFINDWFSWRSNALSDLGNPNAKSPMVFNLGLIIGGILAMPFPILLSLEFKSLITRIGAYLMTLGLVFLIMIGVFPEGKSLHNPVSWAFFLTMFIAILVMGFGLIFEDRISEGFFGISLSVASFFLAIGNHYWSIAVREIIGALSMTIWVLYWDYKTLLRKPRISMQG